MATHTPYQLSRAVAHEQAVKRVIEVMHECLHEPLTLQRMADIAYFSPFHFNRIFKKLTGIPPNQFLYALRLQRAKELLVTTASSVTTICLEVGYNSIGSFTNRFTELVGVSPNTFRRLPQLFEGLRHDPLRPLVTCCRDGGGAGTVRGRVRVDDGFEGIVYVGLCTNTVAHGLPAQYVLRRGDGTFSFSRAHSGEYFVLALALPRHATVADLLTLAGAYRERCASFAIDDDSVIPRIDLTLIPPHIMQPPILTAIPLLVLLEVAKMRTRQVDERDTIAVPPFMLNVEQRFRSLLSRM